MRSIRSWITIQFDIFDEVIIEIKFWRILKLISTCFSSILVIKCRNTIWLYDTVSRKNYMRWTDQIYYFLSQYNIDIIGEYIKINNKKNSDYLKVSHNIN